MTDRLDTLLSHPLDEVADAGFSATVVAHVTARKIRRARIEAAMLLVGLALLLISLPFTAFGQKVEQMGMSLANSSTFALTLATLVLSLFLVRFVLD